MAILGISIFQSLVLSLNRDKIPYIAIKMPLIAIRFGCER
jgi:hypothetical protein